MLNAKCFLLGVDLGVELLYFNDYNIRNITLIIIFINALLNLMQTRVANLLGVAGTDIPIQDIQRLMMPHIVSK